MAQFVSNDEAATVYSHNLRLIVDLMEYGKDYRSNILKKNGIDPEKDLEVGMWIPLQSSLNVLKDVYDNLGEKTLFMLGVKAVEVLPYEKESLKEIFNSLNQAYLQFHKGIGIGKIKLLEYNEEERAAVLYNDTPYPSELDRGILSGILRKFRPENSTRCEVVTDYDKENKLSGGDSTTYILRW